MKRTSVISDLETRHMSLANEECELSRTADTRSFRNCSTSPVSGLNLHSTERLDITGAGVGYTNAAVVHCGGKVRREEGVSL